MLAFSYYFRFCERNLCTQNRIKTFQLEINKKMKAKKQRPKQMWQKYVRNYKRKMFNRMRDTQKSCENKK